MYPQLTTPGALQTFMSRTFGPVDGDSIVLSMKSPKKKPPYAIAAVPFKTISDAHAAVCASCRADRGLDEFEITWMDGSEPAVWSWAERMLKSKEKEQRGATTTTVPAMPAPAGGARDVGDDAPPASIRNNARGGLPQDSGAQSSPATGPQFSSFPSSFSGLSPPPPPPSSTPRFSAPGLDFESAVLMRMRQAERERLEREIREQEASDT